MTKNRLTCVLSVVAISASLVLSGCNRTPEDIAKDTERANQMCMEYLSEKYPGERFECDINASRDLIMGTYSYRGEVKSLDTGTEFKYSNNMDTYGTEYFGDELYDDLLKYCEELSVDYDSFTVTDLNYEGGIVCYMGASDNMFTQDRDERLQTLLSPANTSFYVSIKLQLNTHSKLKLEQELQSYIGAFPHMHYVELCDDIGNVRYEAIMYTSAYGGDKDFVQEWIDYSN